MTGDLSRAIGSAGPEGATFDDVAVAAAQRSMTAEELLAWWDAQIDAGRIEPEDVPHRQRRFRLAG